MSILLRRTCVSAAVGKPTLSVFPSHHTSRRWYLTTTAVCRDASKSLFGSNASTTDATSDAQESRKFADIGNRLYSLQMYHLDAVRSGDGDSSKFQHVAHDAWELLQSIPDDEVDRLSTRNIAEIVCAYNYFASQWENGMEGPSRSSSKGFARRPGSPVNAIEDASHPAPVDYPTLTRPDGDAQAWLSDSLAPPSLTQRTSDIAATKRANPLDEILDF